MQKPRATYHIHPSSDVQTKEIGARTMIWQYVVVLKGAVIGKNVNINAHCLIEGDVVIGNHVTIKSGAYLWSGLYIEDHVLVGPNVTFTNNKYPRSKVAPKKYPRTHIHKHVSIGGGAVLLPGLTIGKWAMIGAGAVVTRDVPDFAVVCGNPARVVGRVRRGRAVENADLVQ